jgi:DNA-binding CsgD family transcriptional regulator
LDASEKCTPDFERLLSEAGLSEREAEALRTVAQGLTAEEAGQLMGVTPSTVGTYRQRGYKKLGVSTRSEFLSIPQARAEAASAARNADAANAANNAPTPDRPSAVIPCGEKRANATKRIVLIAIACLIAAFVTQRLFSLHYYEEKGYLGSPSGIISTDYGELPNVIGMRADAAASEVAQSGFCPLFESQASELPSGKVLELKEVKSAEALGTGISIFSWGEGCTSGYNLEGDWKASVVLVVAT